MCSQVDETLWLTISWWSLQMGQTFPKRAAKYVSFYFILSFFFFWHVILRSDFTAISNGTSTKMWTLCITVFQWATGNTRRAAELCRVSQPQKDEHFEPGNSLQKDEGRRPVHYRTFNTILSLCTWGSNSTHFPVWEKQQRLKHITLSEKRHRTNPSNELLLYS